MSLLNFFVNLPVRYIYDQKNYLSYFLKKRVQPELGLDFLSLDEFPINWHKEVAQCFQAEDLKVAVHFPFLDLRPGSMDPMILKASRERLKKAVEVAFYYQPVHAIAHVGYFSVDYDDFYKEWLENSVETWEEISRHIGGEFPLFLENVWEEEIEPLRDFWEYISVDNLGFCLDVGHWFSFGKGKEKENLSQWLQNLAPYLRHLHLHDNDGLEDKHLGLGEGEIPFSELFAGLELLELKPSFTLEPHTQEDFFASLQFIDQHRRWFSYLGVKETNFKRYMAETSLD